MLFYIARRDPLQREDSLRCTSRIVRRLACQGGDAGRALTRSVIFHGAALLMDDLECGVCPFYACGAGMAYVIPL